MPTDTEAETKSEKAAEASTPRMPGEEYTLVLQGADCAIVFDSSENMNVYIPKLEDGAPITKQMWLVLIVQEMFKDNSMMQLISQRVMASDKVTKQVPTTNTTPDPGEAPSATSP